MADRDRLFRFEVRTKGAGSARIQTLRADVRALGMGELRDAVDVALYFVRGKLAPEELSLLGRFLLSDPVEETFSWREISADIRGCKAPPKGEKDASESLLSKQYTGSDARPHCVEICKKPGVTDAVASELVRAAKEFRG